MSANPVIESKLHHNAHVTTDMEAVRKFYEEIIGFPLSATWCEKADLFGKERTYMHCFFDIGNGDCLAFFWFAKAGPAQPGVASAAAALAVPRKAKPPIRAPSSSPMASSETKWARGALGSSASSSECQ